LQAAFDVEMAAIAVSEAGPASKKKVGIKMTITGE
jgi:hypothetical protein